MTLKENSSWHGESVDQEEFVWDLYTDGISKRYEECEDKLNNIWKKYWKKYVKRLQKLWENNIDWYIMWIVDTPQWEKQECEYWWDFEYVNQYVNWWIEWDSFEWYIFYEMPDWKYLQIHYNC